MKMLFLARPPFLMSGRLESRTFYYCTLLVGQSTWVGYNSMPTERPSDDEVEHITAPDRTRGLSLETGDSTVCATTRFGATPDSHCDSRQS